MPSYFCHIPISPGKIGQTVEHSKFKPTQPSPRANGIPCTQVELLGNQIYHITLVPRVHSDCTETGLDAIERLRFLASFPLPGTGKREGGEKTQPFSHFPSHLVMSHLSHLKKSSYPRSQCPTGTVVASLFDAV